ncbi:hypothetical protein BFJ65_g17801 [Fusarium oxysporum f. sp. cepae]|uniref:Uncharacterized protein n=1 Tax=Fusarium oxysporum f. sp. cepae TaxID=396571 RepID=A0A3L6MS37_FUSOX|nr:hypothetical protein BFJ65_g17801 [Fusarium oxysporum f. sp. cepae]
MAALETTPTQTNPDHPIRPAALVCRSDEICRSVGLRFEDGLSDGLSDGRSVSHTDRYRAIVALVQHHGGFFLRRQTVLPPMLVYEDSHHRPLLDLERQGRLHVQISPISVERRHHGDARFPRDPPAFPVAS